MSYEFEIIQRKICAAEISQNFTYRIKKAKGAMSIDCLFGIACSRGIIAANINPALRL